MLSSVGFPGMQHHSMQNQRNPFAIQELLGLSLGPDGSCHPQSQSLVGGMGHHPSGGVCNVRSGSNFYSSAPRGGNHQPVNVTSCLADPSAHHAAAARMYFSANPSAAQQLMNNYMPNVAASGSPFQTNHSSHIPAYLSGIPDRSPGRDSHSGEPRNS